MKLLSRPEVITGYRSPRTGGLIDVTKKILFDRLPKVLLMQLKRFHFSQGEIAKDVSAVEIETELSVPSSLCNNTKNTSNKKYHLHAVIFHIGLGVQHGHYTVAIRSGSGEAGPVFTYIDDDKICLIENIDSVRKLLTTHNPINALNGSFSALRLARDNNNLPVTQQPRTPYICIYSNLWI
ncbi:Ubiquitin carboxyl-terminal hydrolase 10 [Cichlidogyrus casuarinus]|uniref:Ubiquitin carboxyl-terminal hydrolase 10 n=1 Tax=Cichlidogyrus casuarinus TaxID=1844966 RepID=A0ABD2QG08_9PLAT